ncbi:MAG: hypothetical protein HC859_01760 [Bacteroidia bacterium]|nr:hypothetical protein [Bacteroidia bacterium]
MKHAALFFCFLLALLVTASAQEAATGATAAVKVACVGNSITEGSNIEVGKRYPEQLQGLLGSGYEVRNYGLSGRTLLKKGDRHTGTRPNMRRCFNGTPTLW